MPTKEDIELMKQALADGFTTRNPSGTWAPVEAARPPLQCDMVKGCSELVTHIDEKGYVYCQAHGQQRKVYQRCRALTPKELKRLDAGKQVEKY